MTKPRSPWRDDALFVAAIGILIAVVVWGTW
jgi:hypothetical protein